MDEVLEEVIGSSTQKWRLWRPIFGCMFQFFPLNFGEVLFQTNKDIFVLVFVCYIIFCEWMYQNYQETWSQFLVFTNGTDHFGPSLVTRNPKISVLKISTATWEGNHHG